MKLHALYSDLKDEISKVLRKEKKSIVIPYEKIIKIDPKLAEELLEKPYEVLQKLEQFFNERLNLGYQIKVRVKDLPGERKLRIRDIRSEHIGKLIEIEGIIKVSSEVRPVITEIEWYHEGCGQTFWEKVEGFKIEKPKRCLRCKSSSGKFIPVNQKTIDMQRLVIEEPPEQIERGEQPAHIVVLLTEDLCEPKMERRTIPGTRVKVVGVVETLRQTKNQAIMDLILKAIYIEPVEKELEEIEITPEDEEKIKEIARSGNPLEILAKSIATNIYGPQYDHIKKAIVLQLVGGVTKRRPDGTKVRGNIHILLVGDPGTGKSSLLLSVLDIAPKARYVSGVTATSVGLTATVKRDEFLKGGWALEAGALVLASGGICCIDEIEKVGKEELMALHEAMEQQTITIHKANIHATLKTECAILAAANPKFGRWDKMKSIAEQIDLPPTIINRFDLIFVLKDEPNPEMDRIVAEGVVRGLTQPEEGIVPPELLKKYIIYAKKIIPRWTEKAMEKVKEFYITLRESIKNTEVPTIPITTRQLESVIRLAEASARIRLSEYVTEEDVNIAIELLMKSLRDVGINPETKTLDIDVLETGIPSTQRARMSTILSIIEKLEKDFPDGVPLYEILAEAQKLKIDEDKVRETIERLKLAGEIYEPRHEHYKLTRKR